MSENGLADPGFSCFRDRFSSSYGYIFELLFGHVSMQVGDTLRIDVKRWQDPRKEN